MAAYYNERDAYAAQWLRNLIAAGHITPGDVDERDIADVTAQDVRAYEQCHFFAGVGVWSHALRRAGWDDARPIWTGSCPCQPFSLAGEAEALDDDRHVWPEFARLIDECRPSIVVGEQVSSAHADAWLDALSDDMERMGYAVAALAFPAAGVGAPHVRDRLYWLGDSDLARLERHGKRFAATGGRLGALRSARAANKSLRMAYGERGGLFAAGSPHEPGRPPALGEFWRAADWLLCRDGFFRPVESGAFPLAASTPARVGRVRAYGNALNAEAARAFIETVIELSNE